MPGRTTIQQPPPKYNPCGNDRPVTDVAGRLNDLINCYLLTAGEYLKVWIPLFIITVIVLVVMILAARELIKE